MEQGKKNDYKRIEEKGEQQRDRAGEQGVVSCDLSKYTFAWICFSCYLKLNSQSIYLK